MKELIKKLWTKIKEFIFGHKDEIHAKIIELLERYGEPQAIDYIDTCMRAGKLNRIVGDVLIKSIPLGVKKLKQIMKVMDK